MDSSFNNEQYQTLADLLNHGPHICNHKAGKEEWQERVNMLLGEVTMISLLAKSNGIDVPEPNQVLTAPENLRALRKLARELAARITVIREQLLKRIAFLLIEGPTRQFIWTAYKSLGSYPDTGEGE